MAPADLHFSGGFAKIEQNRMQPYRPDLQSYLSAHHTRLVPQNESHIESHTIVEIVERNAAEFLKSSDIAAHFVSSPEFQSIAQRQKIELRKQCSIGLFICIDGRLVPVIIGSPVFDISETKAGLVPTLNSPLDGELELTNPRIIESIIDRPLKENAEILQISASHEDSAKPDEISCVALELMIAQGILPDDSTYKDVLREMLSNTGFAVGATFNRSAKNKGFSHLERVGLTATYDTRTAGLTFDGRDGGLNTTELTKTLLRSDDLITIQKIGQIGTFRRDFTDPATLIAREYMMYNIEKVLMRQSRVFRQHVGRFIENNMEGFTDNQKQAFSFAVARTMATQITTGLYHGGEHPLSAHNEQYIASSTNGLRVGQFDPRIQSFGANVADYGDSVSHLETKVSLAEKIGKMRSPYVAFISESEPEKSTSSSGRNTRAKLRAHRQAIMENANLLGRIKEGKLWLIPVVLQEKTGIVKAIPNVAI
ncbi:MAG: hypothetical protein Q7T54_03565 [Candidatus Levybacteria bacterium]|nr:hypothetical protein [Candidatus Levybacteria bacterium]